MAPRLRPPAAPIAWLIGLTIASGGCTRRSENAQRTPPSDARQASGQLVALTKSNQHAPSKPRHPTPWTSDSVAIDEGSASPEGFVIGTVDDKSYHIHFTVAVVVNQNSEPAGYWERWALTCMP